MTKNQKIGNKSILSSCSDSIKSEIKYEVSFDLDL